MIKRLTAALFVFISFLALSQIPANAALVNPDSVENALADANNTIGYDYFDITNLYHNKSINDNLAVDNWGTWNKRVSGKIYHSDAAVDLGYALVYGSASSFSNGVPDVLGETMGADTFWNVYAPMDAWDASRTFEEREWIYYPWGYSSPVKSLCSDTSFDTNTPGIGDKYRKNIENGIQAFYHNVLGTNWETPPIAGTHWEDYVHVMQPPSANGFGVGRMWHTVSGHLWYLIVPIAPDNYNAVPETVEDPPEPEAVLPSGTIKFVPESCTWRNTDLPVRVYVDGITTATVGGYNDRDYSYTYRSCGRSEHTHHSGCYNADGDLICGITEHTHSSSCYSTSHNSMNWSYSQDWSIGQINVSGTPPLAATANITNNTTVTLSQTGVNKLAAKLNGWNAGTKTWSSGSPPKSSCRNSR